jgi:multiple sugar transport system substrate-binding protein
VKKLLLLRLFLLLIASLCLGACTVHVPQATAEPTTITFYKRGYVEGGTDITSVTNAKAVEMFEQQHPDINVNIVGVPWTLEGNAQLQAALDSGQDINVFSVNPDDLIQFAREGKVSSIEPFLTEQDRADFYASGLQAAAVDGQVYAWPIWVTASSIFANKDLLAERGVDPATIDDPWTWDQFVEAAKQLTYQRPDGRPVYGFTVSSDWWTSGFYPIFYIDGGRILSPDGRRFVQNAPEALSGLQKVADMAEVHQVTPPDFGIVSQADAWEQFKNGQVAMLISTPAFIRQLEEEEFPLIVLPPPSGELGKIVTTGGFGMYGVYNTDDQAKLEASHEFAKYITGSQVAQDVPGYQLAPGLRRSNTGYATTPNREIIAKLVEFGVYEAPVPISADLNARYTEALTAVVTGQKTAEEAMDEIAPIYQKELDAFHNQ